MTMIIVVFWLVFVIWALLSLSIPLLNEDIIAFLVSWFGVIAFRTVAFCSVLHELASILLPHYLLITTIAPITLHRYSVMFLFSCSLPVHLTHRRYYYFSSFCGSLASCLFLYLSLLFIILFDWFLCMGLIVCPRRSWILNFREIMVCFIVLRNSFSIVLLCRICRLQSIVLPGLIRQPFRILHVFVDLTRQGFLFFVLVLLF